ncbi:hypothetical protein cypCar_00017054, partial [Cyprinus carpio]
MSELDPHTRTQSSPVRLGSVDGTQRGFKQQSPTRDEETQTDVNGTSAMEIHPLCTKLCHHKAVELKDDVCEKQSAVTINPRHMRKAFRIMNELR